MDGEYVLLTRNLRVYKRQPAPLLASLYARLLDFVRDGQHGAQVRAALAAWVRAPAKECTSDDVRQWLEHPPSVVLVQGNVDVLKAIQNRTGTPSIASVSTARSTTSNGGGKALGGWTAELAPDDLVRDAILLPFTLHQSIQAAQAEGDAQLLGDMLQMCLANLVVELTHCLFTSMHGHRPNAGARKDEAQDVGYRVLAQVLGASFEHVTFTDGISQVVKHKLPASAPPLVSGSTLTSVLGRAPTPTVDVTAYGATAISEIPAWRKGEPAPVVSLVRLLKDCQHGDMSA